MAVEGGEELDRPSSCCGRRPPSTQSRAAGGDDVERLDDLLDSSEPFGVGGKTESVELALLEDGEGVGVGEVGRQGDEDGEEALGGSGESWRPPRPDDCAEEEREGGEDAGTLRKVLRLLVFGIWGRMELAARSDEVEAEALPDSCSSAVSTRKSQSP